MNKSIKYFSIFLAATTICTLIEINDMFRPYTMSNRGNIDKASLLINKMFDSKSGSFCRSENVTVKNNNFVLSAQIGSTNYAYEFSGHASELFITKKLIDACLSQARMDWEQTGTFKFIREAVYQASGLPYIFLLRDMKTGTGSLNLGTNLRLQSIKILQSSPEQVLAAIGQIENGSSPLDKIRIYSNYTWLPSSRVVRNNLLGYIHIFCLIGFFVLLPLTMLGYWRDVNSVHDCISEPDGTNRASFQNLKRDPETGEYRPA